MNEKFLKKLAMNLKFEPKKEVLENLNQEYNIFLVQIKKIKEFKISNDVKPLIWPNDDETTFLRDDEISSFDFNKDDIFKNTKQKDNLIVIKKVIK